MLDSNIEVLRVEQVRLNDRYLFMSNLDLKTVVGIRDRYEISKRFDEKGCADAPEIVKSASVDFKLSKNQSLYLLKILNQIDEVDEEYWLTNPLQVMPLDTPHGWKACSDNERFLAHVCQGNNLIRVKKTACTDCPQEELKKALSNSSVTDGEMILELKAYRQLTGQAFTVEQIEEVVSASPNMARKISTVVNYDCPTLLQLIKDGTLDTVDTMYSVAEIGAQQADEEKELVESVFLIPSSMIKKPKAEDLEFIFFYINETMSGVRNRIDALSDSFDTPLMKELNEILAKFDKVYFSAIMDRSENGDINLDIVKIQKLLRITATAFRKSFDMVESARFNRPI